VTSLAPPTASRALAVERLGLIDYPTGLRWQAARAQAVRGGGPNVLALLEHEPVVTLGRTARYEHLRVTPEELRRRGAALYESDRGGDVTFHGPGQLVGYPILPIRDWGQGPVAYVRALEAVLIDVLSRFGIAAERAEGLPGVWVSGEKIAAIGVRVSRGVTTHGFALNVNTDLDYFKHIIPCGNSTAGVTSMQRLTGETFDMRAVEDDVAAALARQFALDLVEEDALAGVPDGR